MKKILLLILVVFSNSLLAQDREINWIGFEELDDALRTDVKPVVIYFYTDWCVYCKKMERNAFKDREVISTINKEYYAVKMDAESTENISFEGKTFINNQARTKRNGIHEIPLLLAGRENKSMSFPVVMVLDKEFRVKIKSHEYLTTDQMKTLIKG